MRWEYSYRSGFKTVEIYGEGESENVPPISVLNRQQSIQYFDNLRAYFKRFPDAHVFTLKNSFSDLAEPFFDNDGNLIKPIISCGAGISRTFAEYISDPYNTTDLARTERRVLG